MVVSIYAGDLMTGNLWGKVPAATGSWKVEHRGEGSIEATIPLRGELLYKFPILRQHLAPWRCFLAAITDDGTVLEAGPIRPHRYDDKTGNLTVAASGMRAIFARRFLYRPATRGIDLPRQTFTYRNLSLGTIAKRIVQQTLSNGPLPIDLPQDVPGTHERTWYGYELQRISDLLANLEDVQNGPDIRFEPYLADRDGASFTNVRWGMYVGNPTTGELHQGGPDHVFDASAARSPVVSLDVNLDPDEMGDVAFVTGNGSEFELLMAIEQWEQLRRDGYPLLEVDEARHTVLLQPTLDAHARALRNRSRGPWVTWTLTVRPNLPPRLGVYRVGDYTTVHVGLHPYLWRPNGTYRARVMEISGSLTDDNVKVVLAPTMEDRW